MDQVLMFDKSLQQRLEEFNDVLSGYELLPVSKIQKEWSFYLELTVDPNGWQAVWKIQRRTCEQFGIPYPSVVLVFVLGLEPEDLTAVVKVLAVQDDINLPEKLHVPLIHLWPTKDQDKSVALNLHATANGLEMLRFFYTHIFMPWDLEDDDSFDWRQRHLESRLRLYYDMKNGTIPRHIADHLHGLFAEARKLQSKRELLESGLEIEEIDEDDDISDKSLTDLMELHIRMLEIKNEVDILENPVFRKVIIKKHKEVQPSHDPQVVWLIFEQGIVDDYINFLDKVRQFYPSEVLKFSHPLATTLENANPNDIFLLNESSHSIKSTGALETGGVLRGLDRSKTVITTSNEAIMLDFTGNTLLENLTIDASVPQCAIIVRRGKLVLNNCKLEGDGKSSTHQGIILLAGSSLQMNHCEIVNFSTAIVGNSNTTIEIYKSEICGVNFGLKIYDNCTLKMEHSAIRNCADYGICVETENTLDQQTKTCDFEALNIIPQLKMDSVSGENNAKGNAVINQKTKLEPVGDLFENPDVDPTVCKDEAMNCEEVRGNISPVTI